MTAYAFGEGRVEGKNGFRAIMKGVSLDFDQTLESLTGQNEVAVALGDGELRITGICQEIYLKEGTLEQPVKISFVTQTSSFGVNKEVTIQLNCCTLQDKTFQAHKDEFGNVFTLSMAEGAA
jgi:hypothetical protein